MNTTSYMNAVLSQDAGALRKFFHKDACIKWHCTNEQFTVDEYIRANCEYPGTWDGVIERSETLRDTLILVCRIWPLDQSASFHVVSFIQLKDDLIQALDEYWADDGEAPTWRQDMHLGQPLQ